MTITPISKGAFLVQFTCKAEIEKVWFGGPRTYREDVIAMRQVQGHADLLPDLITKVEVCVHFIMSLLGP